MSFAVLVLVRLANAVALPPASGETLVWEAAAPECPEAPEVHQRLERLLGGDTTLVRAQARVRARASRWRVELAMQWEGHRDVRTLEADRCDTLADATVLLVASAADPLAAVRHAPELATARDDGGVPEPPLAREAALPREGPRALADPGLVPAATAPRPERPRPRDRGWAIGVSGLLDLGSLPRLGAGLGAVIGWRWPRARLFVEGLYLPAQRVPSTASHAREGRVQLGVARLGACARPRVRAVELPLCAGVETGGTRATGFGVDADLRSSNLWVAMFAHGGVVIPLRPNLAAVGRLEVAAPLYFSEYVFGDERLYRPWPVVVRAALGLEFRWGPRNGGRPENGGGG